MIKFVRGHDKPTPSGSDYRVRHECSLDTDCQSAQTCGADKTCSGTDNLKTNKLGDIVYSTPRISPNQAVNGYAEIYKDETYNTFINNTMINTKPIVVAGANDGMVHAFKVSMIKDLESPTTTGGGVTDGYQVAHFADSLSDTSPPSDLGKELWAYIPYNSTPFLKWYCSKGYCHIPMVDARFTVVDASINYTAPTDAKTYSSWRRLLIGAMGIGGKEITLGDTTLSSSIFVLDITAPEAAPTFKWEKPLPDRSLTTSMPAVVRLASTKSEESKNEAGSWYLVMGSGPKSVLTNGVSYKTGTADIYVFNLKTGGLVTTVTVTGTSGVAVGDMMAVDYDSDYQVDDIYFGTYGGTGASQTGKLYRLRLRNGEGAYYTNPASWVLSTVIDVSRPIYASPEVAVDSNNNVWLYFGTGLYLTLEHASATTDNEWLYGFKETKECWKGTGACSIYSNFLDTTDISFTGASATTLGCFCGGSLMSTIACSSPGTCTGSCGANKACADNLAKTCSDASDPPDCPGSSCIENKVVLKVTGATISGGPAACAGTQETNAINCLETQINSKNGWKRAISGQKIFARPFVGGGLVDYTSFQPTSTSCSLGGNTHLISLHYTTGTAYVQPSIYLKDATSGGYGNLTLNTSVKLGTGVPPLGESLVSLRLAGDAYKVITQVSGGLPGIQMESSLGAKSGYILWRAR